MPLAAPVTTATLSGEVVHDGSAQRAIFIQTALVWVSSWIDSSPSAAAVARLLHAAVRHGHLHLAVGVDPDRAGVERAGGAVGPGEVVGPHAGGQAVLDVVGDGVGLLLGVERDGAHHRAEDLLLGDAHRVRHAGEDRRLEEVAVLAVALARRGAPRRPRRWPMAT